MRYRLKEALEQIKEDAEIYADAIQEDLDKHPEHYDDNTKADFMLYIIERLCG